MFSYKDKVELKNKILKLSEEDHIQIFYILKNNNEQYTVNKNGLFFDIINISNNTLKRIVKYIDNKKQN